MNKKTKILTILITASIIASMPIVMAASWELSHNTGDEPFSMGTVTNNTGTQVIWTNKTDPIVITNDGTMSINGSTEEPFTTNDAWIELWMYKIYLDGDDTNDWADVEKIRVKFPSGDNEWVEIDENDLVIGGGAPNVGHLILNDTTYNNGTYVDIEGSPTDGYTLNQTEELHIQVAYGADTDFATNVGEYRGVDNETLGYRITYYG